MDAVAVWYAPSVTKDPKPLGPVTAFKLPIPQVATELHPEGPYFPTEESGLAALRRLYPKADGRGTRIAIVDSGIDLLHPALEQAVDATGNPVPKIVDLGNLSAPGYRRFVGEFWRKNDASSEPANQFCRTDMDRPERRSIPNWAFSRRSCPWVIPISLEDQWK